MKLVLASARGSSANWPLPENPSALTARISSNVQSARAASTPNSMLTGTIARAVGVTRWRAVTLPPARCKLATLTKRLRTFFMICRLHRSVLRVVLMIKALLRGIYRVFDVYLYSFTGDKPGAVNFVVFIFCRHFLALNAFEAIRTAEIAGISQNQLDDVDLAGSLGIRRELAGTRICRAMSCRVSSSSLV